MIYNMSNVSAANDPATTLVHINALAGGILFPMLSFVVWLVIFGSLKSARHQTIDAMLGAFAITSLASYSLWLIENLVPFYLMFFFVIGTGALLLLRTIKGGQY